MDGWINELSFDTISVVSHQCQRCRPVNGHQRSVISPNRKLCVCKCTLTAAKPPSTGETNRLQNSTLHQTLSTAEGRKKFYEVPLPYQQFIFLKGMCHALLWTFMHTYCWYFPVNKTFWTAVKKIVMHRLPRELKENTISLNKFWFLLVSNNDREALED